MKNSVHILWLSILLATFSFALSDALSRPYQIVKLNATDLGAGDQFGCAIGLQNDWVAVGASHHDLAGATDAGAVYIYSQHKFGLYQWGFDRKLTAPVPAAGDLFGASIALADSLIAIGAPGKAVAGRAGAGAAYVYAMPSWQLVVNLSSAAPVVSGGFGSAVAVSGDCTLVGEPLAATAHIFCRRYVSDCSYPL